MENLDLYLKNLTGKDEIKAQQAADYLINNSDIKLFKMLVDKTDFLFDFVRNNVLNRLEKAVNKNNFSNILNLFEIYSPYYDDLFASILAKHANEDLTDKVFEMLETGSIAQKTYSAKYFSYIPDTVALEPLNKYAFSDDEYLSANSAEALGQMQDDISYDTALSLLSSTDDFEKLKAVRFFSAYARNIPLKDVFNALINSKIPENIAGQIPYMVSLSELISSDNTISKALTVLNYILSGLGEILPLSDIFQFELYDVFEYLLNKNLSNNNNESKIALVLLKAFLKFSLFNDNPEYIFDEDKDTKYEIISVSKLLQSKNKEFWNKQKVLLLNLLNSNEFQDIISALHVISEMKIFDAVPLIIKLSDSDNEIIVSEAVSALKNLDSLSSVDINLILEKIKNPNIKAFIQSLNN